MKAGQGSVQLAVKTFGESGKHRVAIMHSLFGRKEDWEGTAKKLAASAGAKVETMDLRCHGGSGVGEFSIKGLAEDAVRFTGGGCLVGHGLGGRAAMCAALYQPASVPRLVVVEATPVGETLGLWRLPRFLGVLAEVPLGKAPSQKEAAKLVQKHLIGRVSPRLTRRLVSGLRQQPGQQGFTWGFDVAQIRRDLELIRTLPLDGVSPYPHPVLFISAQLSDALPWHHRHEILKLFPKAVFYKMLRSGFLVNEIRPFTFDKILSNFISTNTLPKENLDIMKCANSPLDTIADSPPKS